MLIHPSFQCRPQPGARSQGFSILEILVVVGVMLLMVGLILGSTGAISSTQGMSAVQQVTALCDLARARSLRGDGAVLLAFAGASPGATGEPFRSAVLCAEDLTTEDPNDYVSISDWYHLPKGYVFSNVGAVDATAGVNVFSAPNARKLVRLPGGGAPAEMVCVGFGSLGEVVFPEAAASDVPAQDSLLIAVAEGQASADGARSRSGGAIRPEECRWLALRRNSGSPMILP
ncbi:MAG TPA: hypothetical protein VGE29_05865 [Prosthecobacter sp.]